MKDRKIDSYLERIEYSKSLLRLTAQNIITGEQQNFTSFAGLITFLQTPQQFTEVALKIKSDIKQENKVNN